MIELAEIRIKYLIRNKVTTIRLYRSFRVKIYGTHKYAESQ